MAPADSIRPVLLLARLDFKAPERKKLVDQGYAIIVNIGNQLSDLDEGFAERTFKLPNPFYFIP